MSSAHPNTAGAAGTQQKKPGFGSMGRQGRNVGAAKRYGSNRGKLRLSKQNRVNWPLTVLAAVLSLVILVPLYFAVVSSLKDNATIGGFELPKTWNWGNYAQAWNMVNYPHAAWTTLLITVCATALTLVSNTFVAYAIARNMDRPFFKFLYYFFIAAMFVPFTVIMLPLARQMGWMHWTTSSA